MTDHAADVVSKLSPRSVAATVDRLTSLVAAREMTLFAVIDQRAAAATAGLELRATTLVIFGSPAAGTPVMVAAPLAALDLPLKVLIWDDGGQATVSYAAPAAVATAITSALTWPPGWRALGRSPTRWWQPEPGWAALRPGRDSRLR
jgi:uncharacterized protein (DUF302 family)